MKILKLIKTKKFKNFCVTILEIAIVAAIIMWGLTKVQDKLKSNGGTNQASNNTDSSSKQEDVYDAGDEYYLELNIKKSVIIVYQYNKDKTDKKAIKIFPASVGSAVVADKKKLKNTYTWLNTNKETWNKYNVRYSMKGWIQSVNYFDKYSWTVDKASYDSIGKSQSEDENIKLYAKDAKWIFDTCSSGTVLNIVKGSDEDALPLEPESATKLYKVCGWEPTDPEKGNPYVNSATSTVTAFTGTVYVEKGTEPDYLANILMFDENGKVVKKGIKYDEINIYQMGEQKVKYSYKLANGAKLKTSVTYEVIDTTVPIVRISQSSFTYEVTGKNEDAVRTDKVKEAIEKLVKDKASANEGSIKVYALPAAELVVGDNHVRVVATDSEGNVGSQECVVKITFKKNSNKKEDTTKKNNKNNKNNKNKK